MAAKGQSISEETRRRLYAVTDRLQPAIERVEAAERRLLDLLGISR